MKVILRGKRHLGSEAFKVSYAKSFVDDWIKQLKLPRCAYSTSCFKEKLTYFKRIALSLGELLKALEDVIRFHFLPAITGGHFCSDNERILLSLPVRFGGLAIPLFHSDGKYEYENYRNLTPSLTQLIKYHYQTY